METDFGGLLTVAEKCAISGHKSIINYHRYANKGAVQQKRSLKKLQYFENIKNDLNSHGKHFGIPGMGGFGAITTQINGINVHPSSYNENNIPSYPSISTSSYNQKNIPSQSSISTSSNLNNHNKRDNDIQLLSSSDGNNFNSNNNTLSNLNNFNSNNNTLSNLNNFNSNNNKLSNLNNYKPLTTLTNFNNLPKFNTFSNFNNLTNYNNSNNSNNYNNYNTHSNNYRAISINNDDSNNLSGLSNAIIGNSNASNSFDANILFQDDEFNQVIHHYQ